MNGTSDWQCLKYPNFDLKTSLSLFCKKHYFGKDTDTLIIRLGMI